MQICSLITTASRSLLAEFPLSIPTTHTLDEDEDDDPHDEDEDDDPQPLAPLARLSLRGP